MAVVPMRKVQLVVHESDVDSVLEVVQKSGAMEFHSTERKDLSEVTELEFPFSSLLPRVQHAIQFLEPYAPEVSLWQSLRVGVSTTLSAADLAARTSDTDAVESVVDDLESLQVEFAEVNEKIKTLEEKYDLLSRWRELPIKLNQLSTQYTFTLLVESTRVVEEEDVKIVISDLLKQKNITFGITEVSDKQVAVTIVNDVERSAVTDMISEAELAVVVLPAGEETPEIEITAVAEALAAAKGESALLHDQAEHFAITHINNLQIIAEALSWQRDRFAVIDTAAATKHAVVFTGWLNQNRRNEIEDKIRASGLAAALTDIDPAEGEEPPVEIENSPLVQPFEAVTRLYGMPGYKDLDPTVFLAGFFFLFFGLSLTDVGYGIFLMIVSAFVLAFLKVAPVIRMFMKLLLFVGFSTVMVGLLFGGYLGIAPEYIPEFLKKLQMYDPIGNPLPVFYTALGLGVVQVMFGMMLKIYSEYCNGRLLEGVLDKGPWLFVFMAAILYLATATGYADWLMEEQVINLIYVGVALIVISSARKGDTIIGRVRSAALSLYDSIGYFSDILSYSRLLALGLATTALAFAVNLIAGMVSDVPVIGGLLAVAILIVGHLFTLAVNTLGAFIHSARLQFVEFFGKFIAGTGRSFQPLSRIEKYIAVKDD